MRQLPHGDLCDKMIKGNVRLSDGRYQISMAFGQEQDGLFARRKRMGDPMGSYRRLLNKK